MSCEKARNVSVDFISHLDVHKYPQILQKVQAASSDCFHFSDSSLTPLASE